jgi:hypothetical protein
MHGAGGKTQLINRSNKKLSTEGELFQFIRIDIRRGNVSKINEISPPKKKL